MSGHDSPIAGHIESRHTEQLLTGLVPASPSLDRIKICCEDKNGPLRVGACGETKWPKHGPLSRSAGYCDIVGAD
jgi:hypothetical protein